MEKAGYKSTLNLPRTDFPMKADLPKREPTMLSQWESGHVYERLIEKNRGREKFILHDGPPYANGHIHFGHILNKILKDIIVKYKNMSGFFAPFVPGWDCHGLPIELGAIKEMTSREKDPQVAGNSLVRRGACREYALRFVSAQSGEFRRLGVFGDWEHPYRTLDPAYEADIAREFLKLYLAGYIYRGRKPVYWCSSCKTALAEAEVEYENHTSPSVYVKFRLKNANKLPLPSETAGKEVYFVIWTTTPWTLPANLAIAVGEGYDYSALACDEEIYLVATELKSSFLQAIDFIGQVPEVGSWKGGDLASSSLLCDHPFMNRQAPVVSSDHVTLESGTGVVHIAPGHGQEDYEIGQKFGLDTLCPVDAEGRFAAGSLQDASLAEVKSWEGMKVAEANKPIVDFLFQKKFLLNEPHQNLTHSYPHCWRCKNPVIFRATEQWFCSLAHQDLRKKALRSIIGEIQWIPSWGQDRIYGMIESRPDWCLSRQRIWGVPIIIHYCRKCREPLLNEAVGNFICGRFTVEGADAWWKEEGPLLPAGTRCRCGGAEFEKEKSILDVWFDSGVSHAAVLEKTKNLEVPAHLYLEGSDQHRGWFHSSLLTSLATRNRPPYKAVLTHGFVVDGEGKKYSKSAKNYVPPEKIINEMGAELLRLWVAAEDYRNDIRVSTEIFTVLAEVYRKIRNTCRFLLGNLFDFDAGRNLLSADKRTEMDRYLLSRLSTVIAKIEEAYKTYELHVVHHTLNKFFTVDLSATYLDILKDRLYCDRADGFLRRSAQSTLYDILVAMVPLMGPILSFTAEDIWRHFSSRPQREESVFLAPWPRVPAEWVDKNLEVRWERVWTIRDEVLKVLEGARQKKEIGHSLDARVILSAEGETLAFLRQYEKEWPQIFIVSQGEVSNTLEKFQFASKVVKTLKVAVAKANGSKCERCWNYSVDVGKIKQHTTLCQRCAEAVS